MKVFVTFAGSALALCAGCTLGPKLHEFAPAREPAGIHAEVSTYSPVEQEKKFSGELLAISDDGVLVLSTRVPGGPLLMVPYSSLRTVEAEQRGRHAVFMVAVEERRSRLRRLELLTRYPQGVSPELMRALLTAYGQGSLHRISSPP